MKKKGLIHFMVSGVLAVTVAMSGCSETEEPKDFTKGYYEILCQNAYLVVDEGDQNVLHKGNAYVLKRGHGYDVYYINLNKLEYNCGETLISNYPFSVHENQPNEDKYDDVCDECFGL